MHKAITIMQFKLEGQLIKEHPEFEMEKRLLLDKINIEKGTVCVEETEYPLKDVSFPTIDWEDPYRLSEDEADVMERLVTAFVNCENCSVMCVFCIHREVFTKYIMETFSTMAACR